MCILQSLQKKETQSRGIVSEDTVYSWANSQWPNKDWWLVPFTAGGNAGLGKLSLYTRRQLYSKHWQFIELLVCSPARGLKGEHLCLSTFWPPSASIWLKPAQSKSNSCATVNIHLPGNAACRKDQKVDIERRTTKKLAQWEREENVLFWFFPGINFTWLFCHIVL